MTDLILSFKVQNTPLGRSPFETPEPLQKLDDFPNENFEEFVKKSMQVEPINDVPDTIWTYYPKCDSQKRI